jgi:transcriptional regulator with XRE-family HTH domain
MTTAQLEGGPVMTDPSPPPGSTRLRLNGPVIRFAMRIRGWSQAELARRIGTSEPWMSRLLRGESTTEDVVKKILAAFDGRLRLEEVVTIEGFSPGLPTGARDIEVQ